MFWLAPPQDFRGRLAQAKACETPAARLEALAALANTQLSFLETIQVDSALSKTAAAPGAGFDPIKLAVLSNCTVDQLLPPLRVAGLRRGLRIETYLANYGQYRQDLLDPASPLRAAKPDVILLSLSAREFTKMLPLNASAELAAAHAQSVVQELRTLWKRGRDLGALVIQQSFLDVSEPLFGGLDAIAPGAPSRMIAQLNLLLADTANADGVLWLDAAREAARDGLTVWHDPVRWLQGKLEIAPQAAAQYGELTARLIGAARGKSKKCLVLDLDNTLWGGVIGDDGMDGIVLGEGSGRGEAHLALQAYARALKERGIILAVCSKNETAIAEAVFNDHPEMLLKRGDIAAFYANWTPKAENLKAIAKQLNIGIDSLVFVDDNPVERAHIRDALPMVAVPELPADPAFYVRYVAAAGYFEAAAFTREDQERAQQYSANAERDQALDAAGDMETFLQQLNMVVEYGPVTPIHLARATQLINKTNQFNTTTIRRTEPEMQALAADDRSLILQFRLADKFGDNGLVSVLVAIPHASAANALQVDGWVMSCRVFGRQLEDEAMNILVEAAQARGIAAIYADYAPTAKNAVVQDLYSKLGFQPAAAPAEDGSSRWVLQTDAYVPRATKISRKRDSND